MNDFHLLLIVVSLVALWCSDATLAFPQYDYSYDYDEESIVDEEAAYEPPHFLMPPQKLMAKEGDTVIIPCQWGSGDPNSREVMMIKHRGGSQRPETLLYVGDLQIVRGERRTLNNQMMKISNLRLSDAGSYICRIESYPQAIEIIHSLDIQYGPNIKLFSQPNIRAYKGDSVSLACQAEGYPTPFIKWSRQEGLLPSGAMEEEGMQMTFTSVDRHNEGTYTCTADNGIGKPASADISLSVVYKPEVIIKKDVIPSDDGFTIEMVCIVHASPDPEIKWTKEGNPIALDSHVERQENGGHNSYFNIHHITAEDFGDYVCTAENMFGVEKSVIPINEINPSTEISDDSSKGFIGLIVSITSLVISALSMIGH